MAIYNESLSGGLNVKDCTADASKIMEGYTAGVGNEIVTGSMSNNGDASSAIVNGTLLEGYTSGGVISGLTAENVRENIDIGGILGTMKAESKFISLNVPLSGGGTDSSVTLSKPVRAIISVDSRVMRIVFWQFNTQNYSDFKVYITDGSKLLDYTGNSNYSCSGTQHSWSISQGSGTNHMSINLSFDTSTNVLGYYMHALNGSVVFTIWG